MATRISEQKMIDENVLLYEERLKTPMRRFTGKNFIPVKYWHIKSTETTSDQGYNDVSEILGEDSPVRYQRIDNFPMYDMEPLNLQFESTDQGLDTSFESQGTIMAGTLVPFQNDFFAINHLGDDYIFRITAVEFDTISSSPCYGVSYVLEYIDHEKAQQLEKQRSGKPYSCILENIGTDERCIIEADEYEILQEIDKMYDLIAETYITFYYNERYNCLLGDFGNGYKIFDPFMVDFIMEHQLFVKRNVIDNLVLIEMFSDNRRRIKYQKTIYRFFELLDMRKLSTFDYTVFRGVSNQDTPFYRWLDESVLILDIPKDLATSFTKFSIFDPRFVEAIRINAPVDSKYAELIQRFARNEDITIDEIDLGLADEILELDDANLEVFFMTPILLYIIKSVVTKKLRTTFEG